MSVVLTTAAPSMLSITPPAIARALRNLVRAPGPLISSLMQSIFFLTIYSGQLENVGAGFLTDRPFIAFLLPLILMTGAATTAAAAGGMVLHDLQNGYLHRLQLASGRIVPFLLGPWVATVLAIALQTALTMGFAALFGYRPHDLGAFIGILGLMTGFGAAVAIISILAALQFRAASATGAVTLVFFGLSFFTGFFAPVDQLSGWMGLIAQFNPLTYIVEFARSIEAGLPAAQPALALGFIGTIALLGMIRCALALKMDRRTR